MWEMLRAAVCAAALAVVTVMISPVYAHPPAIVSGPAERAMAEEVVDFRKRLAKAVASKDAATLNSFYADSYRHTHTDGRVDGRDARIAKMLSGAQVIETATVKDLVITVPNGWAAVATGRSRFGERDVRWTVTYVRTGDSWQLAAAQETAISGAR